MEVIVMYCEVDGDFLISVYDPSTNKDWYAVSGVRPEIGEEYPSNRMGMIMERNYESYLDNRTSIFS